MNPGVIVRPRPSTSSACLAARGARACDPIQAMVPSETSTPARCRAVRPSNAVTFEKYVATSASECRAEPPDGPLQRFLQPDLRFPPQQLASPGDVGAADGRIVHRPVH